MGTSGLYVLISLISFFAGFIAYSQTLNILWDQSLGGDTVSVLYYGGSAFFIVAVPFYLVVIRFIDEKTSRFKGLFYPLGCTLVFFVPAFAISLSFRSVRLFSPEAMLFHSFFITSGIVFGILIWFMQKLKGAAASLEE